MPTILMTRITGQDGSYLTDGWPAWLQRP